MSLTEQAGTHMTPLVSIIVPAFNAEAFIGECLESLVVQTYGNTEIIVVDDGSTDRTAEIVKKEFPGIRYVFQDNSGACSAPRNAGAKVAEGELISFFDADDVMQPECIATHVTALREFPSAGISLVNYQNFTAKDGANRGPTHFETCKDFILQCGIGPARNYALLEGRLARRILTDENFSIASGIVVRRSAFSRLGGFEESLTASEDFDFVYRALIDGDIVASWMVGFRRRIHEQNMSRQTARILSEKINSRARLEAMEPDTELRKRLQDNLGRLYLSVAHARGAFPRSIRLSALKKSLSFSSIVSTSHLRALVRILVGR